MKNPSKLTIYGIALSIGILGVTFSVQAQSQVSTIGKYLCLDYQPFFPIGLYAFPDDRTDDAIWKEAAEAGFNFTLSEESGRHGMYVSKPIPWKNINGQKVSLMELYHDESMLDELTSFLSENENDSTLICWHAPDEPGWFGPSANSLQLGYEAIKAHSEKPVWLNVGPSFPIVWHYSHPRDMLRACDILSEDIYPVPDGKSKRGQGYNQHIYYVGDHTEMLVDLGSVDEVQRTPIWMVLQGFGWGDLGFDNPKDFIPPTQHELRYMAYDAIVHGATGLLWYGPFSTQSPANAEFWSNLKAMASELQEIYPILTCPSELVPEKLKITVDGYRQGNPVQCLIKLLDDRVVVLAVNTRSEPIEKVTFSVLEGNDGQLTQVNVLTEERQIPVADHISWTDSFEGYGVHLYETDIYYSFMRRYYEKSAVNPSQE